jgi:magnesium-transporting ATPase (P-type)
MLDASPHAQTAAAVLQQLGSDPAEGLAAAEVARRCERYGRNELAEPPSQPAWLKLLLQFHQPLLYILLVAGLVKALLGSWTNALVIWAVTVINAVIGYIQEARAEGAIAALARSVSTETTVLRDGQTLRIASRDLVPGDVCSWRRATRCRPTCVWWRCGICRWMSRGSRGNRCRCGRIRTPSPPIRPWPTAAAWCTPAAS